MARAGGAGLKVQEQFQALYDKAVKEVGEASAAIYDVYQMMPEEVSSIL